MVEVHREDDGHGDDLDIGESESWSGFTNSATTTGHSNTKIDDQDYPGVDMSSNLRAFDVCVLELGLNSLKLLTTFLDSLEY